MLIVGKVGNHWIHREFEKVDSGQGMGKVGNSLRLVTNNFHPPLYTTELANTGLDINTPAPPTFPDIGYK